MCVCAQKLINHPVETCPPIKIRTPSTEKSPSLELVVQIDYRPIWSSRRFVISDSAGWVPIIFARSLAQMCEKCRWCQALRSLAENGGKMLEPMCNTLSLVGLVLGWGVFFFWWQDLIHLLHCKLGWRWSPKGFSGKYMYTDTALVMSIFGPKWCGFGRRICPVISWAAAVWRK